jgi:hypothetical protein
MPLERINRKNVWNGGNKGYHHKLYYGFRFKKVDSDLRKNDQKRFPLIINIGCNLCFPKILQRGKSPRNKNDIIC